MKMHSVISSIAILTGLGFTATNGFAFDSAMPRERMQGNITFVSGGVGANESAAIKHAAKYYPLELEFVQRAKPKDLYLADVRVLIKNQRGKLVLDTISDGPFVLARLPQGQYMISADHNGRVETREVRVTPNQHHHLLFEWRA